tara:strand:- start:13835 stop:14035 length:201 start_codon:yes stop_codon:yes gene_type:complete
MKEERLIIILSDFIEQKAQKEKELLFYEEKLDELTMRMKFLRQEIDLTNSIIKIIETESIIKVKVT